MNATIRRTAIVLVCLVLSISLAASRADNPATTKYGSWGFDLDGADRSTKPGNDFFRYANGTWLDKTAIPPDKSAYSLRLAMTDLIETRLHEIMEEVRATRHEQNPTLDDKVAAFYRSFMDEAGVNELGANPIATSLQAVKQSNTHGDLAALMGRAATDFESSLFSFYIDVDLKDPTHYAFYISQGGLGLPDRDYYLKPGFAKQKADYQTYVAKLLKLVNWPDPDKCARDIISFENLVAEKSCTKEQQRDLVATYNPMSIEELEKWAPEFAWKEFLATAQMPMLRRVVVAEKSAFPELAKIYGKTPVDTLRAWHAFHIADNAAPYLSRDFTESYFEMRNKSLSGQQQERPRWKRAVTAVSGGDSLGGDRFGTFGTMGFGVGQIYTAKYFPPSAKAKIESLTANLKAAYRTRIQNLDWMSEKTKREALRKLDTYTIKVGYPDKPRDYAKLTVRQDDLVGNVRRAAEADWAFYRGRFFEPVDKADWIMTPQTNNAYNGSLRDIVFPAGILQPPVFDENADSAMNYGAAGAIIGHELTHGFDDQGRKIDASGALRDWWTPEDAAAFEARAKVLGAQFSEFEPLPGVRVNGQLTMGENIADLGGLVLALDAHRASLQGKPAPVLDGFSGEQRVLLGWAQLWRGKVTENYVRKQVVSDPHAPRQFRVIGPTRNIDVWYGAFDVQASDKMFIERSKRVRIW